MVFYRKLGFGTGKVYDNWVSIHLNQYSGVGCEIGLNFGHESNSELSGIYRENDSTYTFALIDNALSDCDSEPTVATFTAVKK